MADSTRQAFETSMAVNIYGQNQRLSWAEDYLFKKYFLRNRKILDLGCGAGRTTAHLKKAGLDVIGVDYSSTLVQRAKQLHPKIKFLLGNASRLPFKDQTFDYCLFSFNGLDYLFPYKSRLKALKEINRVLKRAGLFIFSSHNSFFIPNTRDRLTRFLRTIFEGRVIGYRYDYPEFGKLLTKFSSPWQIKSEMTASGFKPVEVASKVGSGIKAALFDPFPYYVYSKLP